MKEILKLTNSNDTELNATNLLIAFAEATHRYQMFGDAVSASTVESIVEEIMAFAAEQHGILPSA